ncbi:hypothetical protein T484DRAFT_1764583, partial [Baffinella frigidus]
CPKLKRLVLRNVNTISDEGLQALAGGCRFLTELDLTRCKVLSDDGMEELAAHCKHLERLCINAAGDMDDLLP